VRQSKRDIIVESFGTLKRMSINDQSSRDCDYWNLSCVYAASGIKTPRYLIVPSSSALNP